jgi:hypothetical protein
MKSVTFSDILRVPERPRYLFPLPALRRLTVFALSLALGLPALVVAFHLLDPTAPLGYIVIPVLAGGLLPLAHILPGRLEVTTRFRACHLVGTLDEALGQLGYVASVRAPGSLRYQTRAKHWQPWRSKEIAVTVHDHALELTGPVPALRAQRRRMTC